MEIIMLNLFIKMFVVIGLLFVGSIVLYMTVGKKIDEKMINKKIDKINHFSEVEA